MHLARLGAGWSGCDRCELRHETEGLAHRTVRQIQQIRAVRNTDILRTEYGVRGPYINAITRNIASQLVRVFCRVLRDRVAGTNVPDETGSVEIRVVTGYDARSSSPDIYTGVMGGIRDSGLSVIDIGRTTAASLLEAIRSSPGCSGAFMVTGASQPVAWTGFDVYCGSGDSLPVVWRDFGIHLQRVGEPEAADEHLTTGPAYRDSAVEPLLDYVRRQSRSDHDRVLPPVYLALQMPPEGIRDTGLPPRIRRSRGVFPLEFESTYRFWLRKWYPEHSSAVVLVLTNDPLIQQRTVWLSEQTGIQFICRNDSEPHVGRDVRFRVQIGADDQHPRILDQHGRAIAGESLTERLNQFLQSRMPQVTAHADSVSGRFWLTNSTRAHGRGVEQIRDALVFTGLLTRMVDAIPGAL